MKEEKYSVRMSICCIISAVFFLITHTPAQVDQITVHVSTNPGTVSTGQPTVIQVRASSAQGTPIPNAHVKISAGGGFFLDSKDTKSNGQTDGNGVFLTEWKCTQCAGAYVFSVEVTKPGFQKGTAQAKVNITTSQPVPIPGGKITVHANTNPGTVSIGQPTVIQVRASSAQGTPIPNAHVKISAGGGFFLDTKDTTSHGQTDGNGVFLNEWKCTQCAGAYIFSIEVTKPGFQKGTAQAKVNITTSQPGSGQKPPPPPPQTGPQRPANIAELYAHASAELLAHQLPPGKSMGNPGRDSKNHDAHFKWASGANRHLLKNELIAKFKIMVKHKAAQGQLHLAAWYAQVCTEWAHYKVNFGSEGANSKDFHIHEKWAMGAKPKVLEGQLIMRIRKLLKSYGY